jgi:flagellar basal-body rod protein FlgF
MQSELYVTLSAQVALNRLLTTIATNIANQSTPGYRAEEVDFKTLVSQSGDTPVAYVSHGDTYISRQPGVPIKTVLESMINFSISISGLTLAPST